MNTVLEVLPRQRFKLKSENAELRELLATIAWSKSGSLKRPRVRSSHALRRSKKKGAWRRWMWRFD
jgi:hypothetical protein